MSSQRVNARCATQLLTQSFHDKSRKELDRAAGQSNPIQPNVDRYQYENQLNPQIKEAYFKYGSSVKNAFKRNNKKKLAGLITGQLAVDPYIIEQFIKPILLQLRNKKLHYDVFKIFAGRFLRDEETIKRVFDDSRIMNHFNLLEKNTLTHYSSPGPYKRLLNYLEFSVKTDGFSWNNCEGIPSETVIDLMCTGLFLRDETNFYFDIDVFEQNILDLMTDIHIALDKTSYSHEWKYKGADLSVVEKRKLMNKRNCLYQNLDEICALYSVTRDDVTKDAWNCCFIYHIHQIFSTMPINRFRSVIDRHVKSLNTIDVLELHLSGNHAKYLLTKRIQKLENMEY